MGDDNIHYMKGKDETFVMEFERLCKTMGIESFGMTFKREGEFNYLFNSSADVTDVLETYGAITLLADTFKEALLGTERQD